MRGKIVSIRRRQGNLNSRTQQLLLVAGMTAMAGSSAMATSTWLGSGTAGAPTSGNVVHGIELGCRSG